MYKYTYMERCSSTVDANCAPQTLFGKMMDVAYETVYHYRSDFYHDATYVREMFEQKITKPISFFYATRENGTWVHNQLQYVDWSHNIYRFTIKPHDRWEDCLIVTCEEVVRELAQAV